MVASFCFASKSALVSPQVAQQASKNATLVCPARAYCTIERIAGFSSLSSTFEVLP